MNSLSFEYSYIPKPRIIAPFKYYDSSVNMFPFMYQRYTTLLNTSLSNDLVAISKVATKSFILNTNTFSYRKNTNTFLNNNLLVDNSKQKKLPYNVHSNIYNNFSENKFLTNLKSIKINNDNIFLLLRKGIKDNNFISGTLLTKYDLNILNTSNYSCKRFDMVPYIEEKIYNAEFKIDMNINDKIKSLYFNGYGNINNQIILYRLDNIANINSIISVYAENSLYRTLNINKIINVLNYSSYRYINKYDNIYVQYQNKICNINDIYNIKREDNIINENKIILAYLSNLIKDTSIIKYNSALRKDIIINLYNMLFCNRYNYVLNLFNNNIFGYKDINKLNILKTLNIPKDKTILNMNNDLYFNIEGKHNNIFAEFNLFKVNHKLNIYNDNYNILGYLNYELFDIFKSYNIYKDDKNLNIYDILLGKLNFKYMSIFTNKELSKDKKNLLSNIDFILNKDKKNILIRNYEVLFQKYIKNTQLNNLNIFLSRFNLTIATLQNDLNISKNFKLSFIDYYNIKADNTIKNISIAKNQYEKIFKTKIDMIIIENHYVKLIKEKLKFDILNTFIGINKKKKGMFIQEKDTNIEKPKCNLSEEFYNIYINFLEKQEKNVSIYNTAISIFKTIIDMFIYYDNENIHRYIFNADYLNSVNNSYTGTIIPISKTKYDTFIDYIDEIIKKDAHESFINKDLFTSVLPKNVFIDYNQLLFDKDKHNTIIDYYNYFISKEKIKSIMQYENNFGIKSPKESIIFKLYNIKKQEKDTWINYNNIMSFKKKYNVNLNSIISVKTPIKKSYVNPSLFVDKSNKICYYDYSTYNTKIKLREANIVDISSVIKTPNYTFIDYASYNLERDNLEAFFDKKIILNKDILESDICNSLREMHNIQKEVMIEPNDFGHWAWVYEPPDPFDPEFGIDELLLPEEDTRYSDFENIIFNKETLTPRNPVRVINSTTFVAKYPTQHPIPKYSDIAKDYDESAIKFENYYGIDTEIMRKVFLQYYHIWQNKVFEFGTLDMVTSVKKMLEYLYTWIYEYFPVEDIPQALRVFKLIRWYGESAIITNSQYIISYEYDTAHSNLHTGKCDIPNNLNVNASMYIDPSLAVIRNTNIGIDSYIEFYIDNKINTTFTFSLVTSVGRVNIYLNDVLLDTVSISSLNLTYDVPYTGDTNIIKIEKVASDNLNKDFYIGNITVPHLSFKNLSVEFDPTIKMGNKPLDEIAKKMIKYANLYDDVNIAYYQIMKGNLSVSEAYKLIKQYWDLHHQNKTKGKRLTIKQI